MLNQAIPYILEELDKRFGKDHVHTCYGWQTAGYREENKVPKWHDNDAVCIAAIGAKILANDNAKEHEIKQFRRHNRQLIHAQHERAYYTNPKGEKAVCKNRHKRFEQKCDSLEEYRKAHPDMVSKLFVKKSVRYYNRLGRILPGTTFLFAGERYIMSGQHSDGEQLRAVGYGAQDFALSRCTILQRNKGLVWL